ncbi:MULTISPECIES: DNA methyltransferase [Cyanophyceae]|uniref:DNA-methyltransferase n=1 Tax=Cyanophyceae TaxID=3028117 RepID=UPI001688B851|nr:MULTISPECIES: DNA methyltransferase [Cyanophyceae]MBD1918748.1 site-specific DNA-methyltransferase [Phormidium sp. FACHB-77]MBD2033401.1 site-specific DNA-methyltransferase [Phormidium sp. FACHB-322]MBD2053900.1 site-specific DNA-methyltransferase [Leptolyngbya sp. FACHB-60]
MKARAPKNRTLDLTAEERDMFLRRLINLNCERPPTEILNRTICQDLLGALPYLPKNFVDLLIVDPPYNLTKDFNGSKFRQCDRPTYIAWLDSWISQLKPVLKPNASAYFCADWTTSTVMYPVLEKYFTVRNRITWEREKGRGAQANWKNASEDIWFCTVSETYTFNVDAVKLKRRVMAPYRNLAGQPKDWDDTGSKNYRLTHPSNLWTDITVPFWSMTENTDHPTQKPEKLVAKLLLASSNAGDVVLDPFLGSGTTAVVAKKLGRQYVGIEQDPDYCCLAEKRLTLADLDPTIQGYADGVFWERNTLAAQRSRPKKSISSEA